MIIFENQGGSEAPIGFFGTGLKYALVVPEGDKDKCPHCGRAYE